MMLFFIMALVFAERWWHADKSKAACEKESIKLKAMLKEAESTKLPELQVVIADTSSVTQTEYD